MRIPEYPDFEVESPEQRKGFGDLVIWLHRKHSLTMPQDTLEGALALYFIQKHSEAQKWLVEAIGTQISSLQDDIRGLQNQIAAQEVRLNALQDLLKTGPQR